MHFFARNAHTIKSSVQKSHLFWPMSSSAFDTTAVIEHVTRSVCHTLAAAFSSAANDSKFSLGEHERSHHVQLPVFDADPRVSAPASAPASAPSQFKEAVINLYASEVGAYIGKGSWLTRTEALGSVWARTNKQQMDQLASLWKTNGCKLPTGGAAAPFAQSFDPFPHVRSAADVATFCSSASQADILLLYKTKGQLCEEALITRFASSHAQHVMCRHASVMWKSDTDTAAPKLMTVRPPGTLTDPGLFTITGIASAVQSVVSIYNYFKFTTH